MKHEHFEMIRALLRGEDIECNSIHDKTKWLKFNKKLFLSGDPFGPWACDDRYQWRVKPKTTSVELTFEEKVVNIVEKKVQIELEGVKEDHSYKKGDTIYYIYFNNQSKDYRLQEVTVNHNNTLQMSGHIRFETEEASKKAFEKIQSMKGQ